MLFTPDSIFQFFLFKEIDKSETEYEGICPITPLKFPSMAFDESVNWLDNNDVCQLSERFLYPNLNPLFKLCFGTNSTELPSIPT